MHVTALLMASTHFQKCPICSGCRYWFFLFLIKERKEEYGQKTYQWHVKYTSKKRNITPLSLELDNFYKKLSESGKPVLLSLVPTYSKAYVPLYELGVLPKPSQIFLRKNYPILIFYHSVNHAMIITITAQLATCLLLDWLGFWNASLEGFVL